MNTTVTQPLNQRDLRQIGFFLYSLRHKAKLSQLKHGADIRELASSTKLAIPRSISDGSLTYWNPRRAHAKSGMPLAALTFYRDKNLPEPDPQELKLICIRRCPARRDCYNICLECSWSRDLGFYCTITVSQAE